MSIRSIDSDRRSVGDISEIAPTVGKIVSILTRLGLKVYIIGARSIYFHRVNLGRETRDWDLTIDRPFTIELRDRITEELRKAGLKVQWRKLGIYVEDDVHVDINYAPLILDEEFMKRARKVQENIYLPSLEDLIILKLMSGEKKDITDVKRILTQKWEKIDKEYLLHRARQAGLVKELVKLTRRLGIKL